MGDIAVALAAPWVALRITDNPALASSWAYIVWNLFGVLDLLVAVGTGGLSATLALTVTTAPMARLPLVLVSAYFVPLFIMLHIIALYQSRRHDE